MLLHHSTWPEIEAYLLRSKGVVIPTGSTEQHGPTGLIGTDSITAETIAHAMAERCGALVGPTLTLSQAQLRSQYMKSWVDKYIHNFLRSCTWEKKRTTFA